MSSAFEDLTKKLMDEHIVTKAEMIQAIHENNSDLKEQFATYQSRLENSQKEFRDQFAEYQKEAKVHTRWLVGIGVTLIVGVAALIVKTHF